MSTGKTSNFKRKNLDELFNPESGLTGKSKDLEDPNDIYDHTKEFFKKSEPMDHVDVGIRRIKADIELDDIVYGGKKISRNQLDEDLDDESDDDYESQQDFDEDLNESQD